MLSGVVASGTSGTKKAGYVDITLLIKAGKGIVSGKESKKKINMTLQGYWNLMCRC